MVFERFYNEMLAQASYLVGCGRTGEAIVIDPLRDADLYIAAAEAKGLRITAVTETHIHADYLSGARELASKTGATLYVSDEGGPDWLYAFRDEPGVVRLKDGDKIRIGNVRLDVIHTPGHTPEHLTFLLTDEPASSKALGAFTGDFVFVGDVGRPDLLERAANIKGTMEVGGRQLFGSLGKFAVREDGLLIWPGHGAGSACGKNLGGAPASSLGYEKASNWAFKAGSEDSFVKEVLSGQPDPPKYFAVMKRLNRAGATAPRDSGPIAKIDSERMLELIANGAQVVDLRTSDEAVTGFLPGTLNIPLNKEFLKWSGWLLRYDAPIYLIAKDEDEAEAARKSLSLIGLDDVRGWSGRQVLKSGDLTRIQPCGFKEALENGTAILDVRSTSEYAEGHVPGAFHSPVGYLIDRMADLPRDRRLAIHCATGSRARLAAIVLRGHGFCNICNVSDDFDAYNDMGLPVDVGTGRPSSV